MGPTSIYDLGSDLRREVERHLSREADGRKVDVDMSRLAIGVGKAGFVALAPRTDLEKTTTADLARGAQVGLIMFSADERPSGLSGVYVLENRVAPDATQGTSRLIDEYGDVAAEADLLALPSGEVDSAQADELTVQVGEVTVTVGWVYVCIYWDDPPGTPGGMCHRVCYSA